MERIGGDVRRELSRFGSAAQLGDVVSRWPSAVGDSVARNAWPARVQRDGTLVVHASSSAWAFELTQLEARVRDSLGELAPARIKFVPGPLPSEDPPSSAQATRVEPSPETRGAAARIAASIGDQDLRKLVARAAAASLSEAQSARPF